MLDRVWRQPERGKLLVRFRHLAELVLREELGVDDDALAGAVAADLELQDRRLCLLVGHRLDVLEAVLLQRGSERGELFRISQRAAVAEALGEQDVERLARHAPRLQLARVIAILLRALQHVHQRFAADRQPAGRRDLDRFRHPIEQEARLLAFVLEVRVLFPLRDLEQRRLGDEEVPALDHFLHVTEKERQDERADVRAVDVRVGHDDDLVVAQLVGVEFLRADAGAKRRDQRADLLG